MLPRFELGEPVADRVSNAVREGGDRRFIDADRGSFGEGSVRAREVLRRDALAHLQNLRALLSSRFERTAQRSCVDQQLLEASPVSRNEACLDRTTRESLGMSTRLRAGTIGVPARVGENRDGLFDARGAFHILQVARVVDVVDHSKPVRPAHGRGFEPGAIHVAARERCAGNVDVGCRAAPCVHNAEREQSGHRRPGHQRATRPDARREEQLCTYEGRGSHGERAEHQEPKGMAVVEEPEAAHEIRARDEQRKDRHCTKRDASKGTRQLKGCRIRCYRTKRLPEKTNTSLPPGHAEEDIPSSSDETLESDRQDPVSACVEPRGTNLDGFG